jgi:hypothetical protein
MIRDNSLGLGMVVVARYYSLSLTNRGREDLLHRGHEWLTQASIAPFAEARMIYPTFYRRASGSLSRRVISHRQIVLQRVGGGADSPASHALLLYRKVLR